MIITDDLCCILGMDVGGRCLRHPAIMIMSSSGEKNYNFTSFCTCKICHSGLEAGDFVQRNRLAYPILQVGNSCHDSTEWSDFDLSAGAGEEEKETTSIFMDQVRNALLRASQVQEWTIAEKNNRIVNLEMQLIQSIQENERLRQGDNIIDRKTKDSKMIAPQRQSSCKPQITNALVPQRLPSRRLTNEITHNAKLHFKGHHKNNPPSLPQRQASREKQLRKEISDLTTTSFRTETASDSSTDRIAQILMNTNTIDSLHQPSSNHLEFADYKRSGYLRPGTSLIRSATPKNSMSSISKNVSFDTSDHTFKEEISTSKDIQIDASAIFHEKNSNDAMVSHSRKNQEKNESKKKILLTGRRSKRNTV
jgi:hypothetical protein